MDTTEQLILDADSREESGRSQGSRGFSIPFFGGIRSNQSNNSPESNQMNRSPSSKAPSRAQQPNTHGGGGYSNNRYEHDVQQAKMMREGMEKRKQQCKEITEADIELAFEGLETSESLRQEGKLTEALKISELSIELLIKFLKSDVRKLPQVSRDMVGERVQEALTDAENMKESLRQRNTKYHAPATTDEQSLSHSLTEAIASSKKKSKKKSQQSAGETTTSAPTRKTRTSTRTAHHTTRPSSTKTRDPATNRTIASSLVNSQDPLVQTIKSELYIDQSQLQATTWEDIAGLEDAKQALQEAAILPLMRPDLFSGLRKPRNVLLYGPPGTGKTLLVKAVAHESKSLLFICTASAMTSKWLGEGEKLLRTLFRVAREAAPSIIFVDEMDALLSARKSDGEHEASRRFKTEFMTQMDGIIKSTSGSNEEKHLLVIAATNCPWDIDSAVLRRFPRRIYVPLPDPVTRKALLLKLLEKAGEYEMSKKDISAVVKRLDGFSGSDISSIASEASFGPIRSLGGIDAIRGAKSTDIRPIQRQDFEAAIDQSTKSVSRKLLKQYDVWKEEQAAS